MLHRPAKRQSSTVKVTLRVIELIRKACSAGEGVIVRFRGRELGIVETNGRGGLCYGGGDVLLTGCTIPRSTVAVLSALYG